ncbi:hypothetical protein MF410_32115 (plasmid) [Rhizobium sp. C104]|uniref:hypothetical protein n=1 Tax=Rhizobium sp. C104 TaxID=2917727 RepID=UPI001EF82644|nr:hypothetical protein [Rhizobium sp. C104]ULJ82498.1 hypothetical protein MF410_32115 [Rhizobium sp. C104]
MAQIALLEACRRVAQQRQPGSDLPDVNGRPQAETTGAQPLRSDHHCQWTCLRGTPVEKGLHLLFAGIVDRRKDRPPGGVRMRMDHDGAEALDARSIGNVDQDGGVEADRGRAPAHIGRLVDRRGFGKHPAFGNLVEMGVADCAGLGAGCRQQIVGQAPAGPLQRT